MLHRCLKENTPILEELVTLRQKVHGSYYCFELLYIIAGTYNRLVAVFSRALCHFTLDVFVL